MALALYLQTEYSLLSSTLSLKKIEENIESLGYSSLAIVDNKMYGAYKFYNLCKNKNVKPIIGLRVNLNNNSFENNIILYAKDLIGYKNLIKISSTQSINPNDFNLNMILNYKEGLICVIPTFENNILNLVKNFEMTKAINEINNFKNIFGSDLYLGISLQTEYLASSCNEIINLANNTNIKAVAMDKMAYYSNQDLEAYLVLRNILTGKKLNDTDAYKLTSLEENMSLLSYSELKSIYSMYPFLLENLKEIEVKCNLELTNDSYHFPKAIVKDGVSSKDYLVNLCKMGLNKRLEGKHLTNNELDVYRKRLLYELEVINKMGFDDYFLIVYDYVKYAKTNDILVGPGRGSASGCLVSYSLGITDVDPVRYGLLFERFLNYERRDMPDIDVDFEDDLRSEIFKYLGEKYGQNKVAHINTFGTYQSKLAIKDVISVLGINKNKAEEISKHISSKMTISQAIEKSSYLSNMINTDEEIRRVINIALIIEKMPKNCSTHASGIIMAESDLKDYTALQVGIDGLYQTQFDADDLQQLGLVKFDILGISNLSLIKKVLKNIKDNSGIELKLKDIPLDDKLTYDLLAKGKTLGIFQLESAGMTNVLRKLKPTDLSDIYAALALYRPGPMETIPSFVNRKFGKEKIEYFDKSVEPILKETYGHIVYQEQVINIAHYYAGFSLGEADILRKAVSKKKASLIEELKLKFIQEATKLGHDKMQAAKTYALIEKFADYGFNKSHAVNYALIAYQMAYLKANYPKDFMTIYLSYSIGDVDKVNQIINELKENHISVLPPSVNNSDLLFTYDDNNNLYYPLSGIKGGSTEVYSNIINLRKEEKYQSYDDFVSKTKDFLTKKIITNLVASGALDEFLDTYHTRKSMIEDYEETIQRLQYMQIMSFDFKESNANKEEFTFEEMATLEKEALGFNLRYNVFIKYSSFRNRYNALTINKMVIGRESYCMFMVDSIKEITTKKGDNMAFLKVHDESGQVDVTMFTESYNKYKDILTIDKVYFAKGKLESRITNDIESLSLIVSDIYNLSDKH